MKAFTGFSLAVAMLFGATLLQAEEVKSGLAPGKFIGAFDVVKCSGAADDGVKVGQQLCYRCKYGGRPMVMVFARSQGKSVAQLAKSLDEAIAKNSDGQLQGFVNLLGDDRDALESQATQLGQENKLAQLPVVVPVEFENGPGNYGINPKADVTVIMAVGGKVKTNLAFSKDQLDSKAIGQVLEAIPGLLK